MAKLFVAVLQFIGIALWFVLVMTDSMPLFVRLVALGMSGFYTFATGWWLFRK